MKSFRKIGLLALALSAVACGLPDEWDNTPYEPDPILPEFQKPITVIFTANAATCCHESGGVAHDSYRRF
jgi:hypothetical protein